MRSSGAALAGALVLAAAGCGGGGSAPQPTRTAALTPEQRHGRDLFVQRCGSCHTLADAGTKSTVGPDLDGEPLREVSLREVIASGPGLMPAGLVTGRDEDAVAAYLAAVTRG